MVQKKRGQLTGVLDEQTGQFRAPDPSRNTVNPNVPAPIQTAQQRGIPLAALVPEKAQQQMLREQETLALNSQNAAIAANPPNTPEQQAAINQGIQDIANVGEQKPTTGGQIQFNNPFEVAGTLGAGAAAGATGAGLASTGAGEAVAGALGVGASTAAVTAGGVAALGAIIGKVALDERQKVKEYRGVTTGLPKELKAQIAYVQNGGDKVVALQRFKQLKQDAYLNEANLKAETQRDLTKFLGSPGEEYQAQARYNQNILPSVELAFNAAINGQQVDLGSIDFGEQLIEPQ